MKKFIINICLISALVVVVNLLYLLLLTCTDISFIKRQESMNFSNPNYELLVLGNSLATDAFDTGLLTEKGLVSYNLAIPGSTVKTNYIQLSEYLLKYDTTPKCVILAMGSFTGSFEDETIHPIVEFTSQDYSYKISDLPMIKFRWLAIELMKQVVSSRDRNVTVSYGQFKFRKVQSDNTHYTNKEFDLDRYQESQYMQKTSELCAANHIQLVLIEMPGFKNVQNGSDVGPYDISYKNGSVATMYNFNNIEFGKLFDADKDWIGNSHLNEFGAAKFTEEMYRIVFNN